MSAMEELHISLHLIICACVYLQGIDAVGHIREQEYMQGTTGDTGNVDGQYRYTQGIDDPGLIPKRRSWKQNRGEAWANWMTQQMDNTVDQSGYMCDICGKSYKTKDYLQRHEKSHDSTLIMCKKCTQYFPSQEHYEIHVEMKHGQMERKHICAMCGKGFNRAQYLQRHILQHEKRMAKALSQSIPALSGEPLLASDGIEQFEEQFQE